MSDDNHATDTREDERICSECGEPITDDWIRTETQAHPDCAADKYALTDGGQPRDDDVQPSRGEEQ